MIAAPAAALLAGCAGSDEDVPEPKTRRVTSVQGDIELLTVAWEREAKEIALYEGGAPRGQAATWRRFDEVEREHLERLGGALRDLGAPRDATGTISGDGRSTVDEAIDAEADAIAFWLDTIPKLYDPDLRTLAAGILTAEAEQMAVLRDALGLDPAPEPFVYGWTRHGGG